MWATILHKQIRICRPQFHMEKKNYRCERSLYIHKLTDEIHNINTHKQMWATTVHKLVDESQNFTRTNSQMWQVYANPYIYSTISQEESHRCWATNTHKLADIRPSPPCRARHWRSGSQFVPTHLDAFPLDRNSGIYIPSAFNPAPLEKKKSDANHIYTLTPDL
jgi:hypothetical protein